MSSDLAVTPPTRVLTRSVRGRGAAPYRGTVEDDPRADRYPSPPRMLDEIGRALSTIRHVTTVRTGQRFDLRRGPTETLVVACRPGAAASLADLTFVGNEYLAILAVEALVPLFGAIELAIGDYRDIVDDTEPGVAYARYEQAVRERTERELALLEKQRAAIDQARLAMADHLVKTPAPARNTKLWAAGILAAIAVVIGGVWAVRHYARAPVGAGCDVDGDCRSGSCYARDTLDGALHAVCTETCTTNADCPSDMRCWRNYRYEYEHRHEYEHRSEPVNVCTPRHWTSAYE